MPTRLALIAVAVLCASCATAMLSQRYPSSPPAGMTPAQAEADRASCLEAAKRAAAERAWSYIGCMVAKGHTVAVAFHVRGQPAHMYVTQTRPHAAARVEAELGDCRVKAYKAGRAEAAQGRDVMLQEMEKSFRTCIGEHGYAVERVEATAR
jgi:hypothetical protein